MPPSALRLRLKRKKKPVAGDDKRDSQSRAIWYVLTIAVLLIVAVVASPPLFQDENYHNFADQREWWRVPNFWNVISNAPFVFAGLYGVWAWKNSRWQHELDRWPWLAITAAAILVGFGSGYYHWRPNNPTLFWDRLPMTFVFMGLFSAAIMERVNRNLGALLLGPLLLAGVLSIVWWKIGESSGGGDLRYYALVQFYPAIALPIILWNFPSRYSHGGMMWRSAILYLLAKGAEQLDRELFRFTAFLLSGHTIKHFLSAWALYEAFRMLRLRRPAGDS